MPQEMSEQSNEQHQVVHAGTKRRSPSFVKSGEMSDDHGDHQGYSGDEKIVQTTKSKGIVNVQLFIRKAFAMINECDPSIACWTEDGDKFVVKNKEVFAATVIPQYYDHSNYSSFTRQLNFYGFTREQSMTIKVSDLNSLAVGQETFYHQYFQRGRPDLLKNLQRKSSDNKNTKKRKKPRTDTDVGFLQGRIESLEETTKEMMSTIKMMREENFASVTAIRDLQNLNAAKDEKIDSLEKRIDWLERRLTTSALQREESFLSAGQRLFGGGAAPVGPTAAAAEGLIKNAWSTAAENVASTYAAAAQNDASYLVGNGTGGDTTDANAYSANNSGTNQGGPTLARHPKMKKFGAANPSSSKDIYSSYDTSSSAAVANNIQSSAPIRESSLDFGFFSGLARESTLLSWLPRQDTTDKALS